MPDKDLPRTVGKVLHKFNEGTASLVAGREPVRVISHYDADGLCAAGILCKALFRKGIPFHATIVHSIEAALIDSLNCRSYQSVLFSDLGSGSLDLVERIDSKVIIIDHHEPLRESRKVVQLNSHLWGIDGAFECCGSTLALMAAVSLDDANWDLAGLAIAGGIGDRQHVGGWKGLNGEILSYAEKLGHIRTRKGLVLEGENLGMALADNNEPFFRGISGNSKAAAELIEAAGVSPAAAIPELGMSDTGALASLLVLRLLRQGTPEEFATGVLVDRHWLAGYDTDAQELSSVINACGRLGQEELGLSVCLGGKGLLEEARAVRKLYRAQIMKGMLELQSKGIQKKRNLQYFYAESSEMAGAYAALVMNFLFPGDKPTIALSRGGDSIKVSARGTRALLSRGLDLAKACRKAAQSAGGAGGGHNIASGATIPMGAEMAFLEHLDTVVGEQMGGAGR